METMELYLSSSFRNLGLAMIYFAIATIVIAAAMLLVPFIINKVKTAMAEKKKVQAKLKRVDEDLEMWNCIIYKNYKILLNMIFI